MMSMTPRLCDQTQLRQLFDQRAWKNGALLRGHDRIGASQARGETVEILLGVTMYDDLVLRQAREASRRAEHIGIVVEHHDLHAWPFRLGARGIAIAPASRCDSEESPIEGLCAGTLWSQVR